MNNQELLAKIEEWIDDNELDMDDAYIEGTPDVVAYVEVPSLIMYLKKLLK